MDGPSSSSAPAPSSEATQKYLLPSDGEDDELPNGDVLKPRILNVDPDYDDDDEDCFEDGGGPPAPISREVVDGAIARRSRDRQISPGVKMSIGNYDDMEEDLETPEEQRRRFLDSMRNIRRKPQEDFDLPSPDNDAMRQFINNQVNSAMMFNTENRLDYIPIIKPKTPKIIQGYLWGGLIGNGSYGKVKEVIDCMTLTRRAAKIMKYERLRKIPNGWENIRSEMSILRRLNHKNIVKLIEVFNLPKKLKVYMIFEYCIGSVQQLIDMEPARRLTIGESHAIFVEMCHGLNYLHSKRVSHKDIKPGNLLVSIDMTVKICDFGVAEQISLFQQDGKCTKVNGTPKFQPPECVYGNHEYFDGYKVDMWSAGITLYNLVSGKYPFEHQILLRLYENIGRNPLEMPTNVTLTSDLQDLIKKLLDKDFNTRLDIFQTMDHDWFSLSFPEDQGLGRVMERMRTGDRPLTMFPSLTAMYDGAGADIILDDDGVEMLLPPPDLVLGGILDANCFRGFQLLDKQPGDGLAPVDGGAAIPESASGDAVRRPSSRSMPTSAPPRPSSAAPPLEEQQNNGQQLPPPPPPVATDPRRRRQRPRQNRGKRSLFSCIFRQRNDSD